MPDNPLLKACFLQQQVLDEVIERLKTAFDRDCLDEAVELFSIYVHQLDRTQRCLLFEIMRSNRFNPTEIGEQIRTFIVSALARGSQLKQAITLNSEPQNAELEKSTQHLDWLLTMHNRGWHWEPFSTVEDVIEAERTGDFQPLPTAFAEIAGMSEAEWLKVVEDYRRRKSVTQRAG